MLRGSEVGGNLGRTASVGRPVARFYVSPSRIARYWYHECDRYLRYATVPRRNRASEGVPDVEIDHQLVTRLLKQGGFAWEERVVRDHLAGQVVVAPAAGDGPLHERVHGVEETLDAIAAAEETTAIYQTTLRPSASFYARYGLDPDLVGFTDCHPDLLLFETAGDGRLEVRVVDVKASAFTKLSHRIQVGLYTRILEDALADAGLDARVTTGDQGGVWLYETDEPEWFDLVRILPPLETFLAHDLAPILGSDPDDTFWHLWFRCEWCDYFEGCRDAAEAARDVSLVPYLSTFAKRHLGAAGVHTVDDLAAVLERDDADTVLDGCASLEGRREPLTRRVAALRSGSEEPTGAAALGLPKGENLRIVASLQSDPLTGEMYGYALTRVGLRDLLGAKDRTVARVAPDGQPGTLAGLRARLVDDLWAWLAPVDRHNRSAPDWAGQKSMQTYVFDNYERDLLVAALLRVVLESPAESQPAARALALLFHFQHPDLTEAEDQPAEEVFFPVVVLTDVVRRVMALPVPVTYRFAEVVERLAPREHAFEYEEREYWSFRLSNRMKSNAILDVWTNGRTDLVPNIESELKRRVWGAGSVLNGLRERLEPTGLLFAWPPKFSLPPGFRMRSPLLSRLAFITKYEGVLAYLDLRERRAAPERQRLDVGDTLRVTLQADGTYVLDPAHGEVEVETSGFANWILTRDDDAGRRARLAFDDFRYADKPYGPKNLPVARTAVRSVDGTTLQLDVNGGQAWKASDPQPGDVFHLEPRYTDQNSEKVISELHLTDRSDDAWFVSLLDDPVECRVGVDVDPVLAETARELARTHRMTPSQLAAFDGVVGRRLQLVWGPPGTGKTHFLALALLCLVEAHRRPGLPLRILVTAFTHTAIDNCLRKLTELQADLGVVTGDIAVCKLATYGTAPVETVHPKHGLGAFVADHERLVAGSTVWQIAKLTVGEPAWDVVVMDEGSQVKPAEAVIPIRRLRPGGRLVIAGDDRQLPPIFQGRYKFEDCTPVLDRSILECLRGRDPDDVCTVPLLENFRMNDVLCAWPAHSIYPATYGPATEEIARRRLPSGARETASELVRLALDPSHPVVVCVLEEVKATRENAHEAALVADIACELADVVPSGSDAEFWRERLFVVSPHRAQNRLIRRVLAERRTWDSAPFVDTVDKMQGQECDCVVVSYGVSDVEYALNESEFIYSLNRLNVAVTRARMKTVVLLSRTLLEPPIQAFDNDDVADGIAFMQGLARFCETSGTPPVEVATDAGRVTVLRA